MSRKKLDEIPKEKISAGNGATKQVLISSEEGPNFAMRKFTIEPGGFMPMHTNSVEHEQIVLNGRASVVIGDETFEAAKDDVVFIPRGIPHSYRTVGDQPFEFICVIPNKEDIMEIVERK